MIYSKKARANLTQPQMAMIFNIDNQKNKKSLSSATLVKSGKTHNVKGEPLVIKEDGENYDLELSNMNFKASNVQFNKNS